MFVRSYMSQYFEIHPDNPQVRLIKQAVEIINNGGGNNGSRRRSARIDAAHQGFAADFLNLIERDIKRSKGA